MFLAAPLLCVTIALGQDAPAADTPSDASPAQRALTTATAYVSARGADRQMQKTAPLSFAPLEQPDEHVPTIILDRDKAFQSMVGIGTALTDASAETFFKLPPGTQQEILTACFDRERGNGYSLCRTNIHSCDFSSASYTYAEVPGDTALRTFSIEHDLQFKIPFIKAAIARTGNTMKLLASPWSPPAWMKTNHDMLHGGKLRPEFSQAWAKYLVRFVQEYGKTEIPIWGLTVQNEPMAVQPWESCIFTAAEERDFVKHHLGPALEGSGLSSLKLMIWDHNRGIMYQRAKVVYDDPAASRYVWGTGFHWYVGNHFDNVRLVRDAFPDKALLFTEGTEASFDAGALGDWKWGEIFGRSLVMDLNNGASGWIAWNVLLDETGGPNHVGNYCMAPIIADTRTGTLTYMNSFYYLGHFSRFIRPGAKRIVASSNTDDLLTTAFLNEDGTIAVVVLNTTDKEVTFLTWIEEKALQTTSPPHSIITLIL